MAQILKDGHLDRILKENPKKLICVLFGNPDFPPCAKAHNLWDKLAPKYSTCIFIYAECDKCQTDARRQEIKQIPTVIFYKNQSILNRIVGVEENEILQFIEENRPLGAFDLLTKLVHLQLATLFHKTHNHQSRNKILTLIYSLKLNQKIQFQMSDVNYSNYNFHYQLLIKQSRLQTLGLLRNA